MRIALIADTFPPMRTSGAVQIWDLSCEFAKQGHAVTVLIPSAEIADPWTLENSEGVQVLRLRAPKTKDVSYIRRTMGELMMPLSMLRNLRKSPLAEEKWDGVVWYSPSIFHGFFASAVKRASGCKGYLIVRDIFPQWAADVGLIGRGLVYRFFDAVAQYQYSVADAIGVQSSGNLPFFDGWARVSDRHVEVLENWLANRPTGACSVSLAETRLAGRRVCVYAGNMGVAQGMTILLNLAERLKERRDIGFLFVGRGSEAKRLADAASECCFDNVLFLDEIEPDEIPGLYAQCHVGLVALHPGHKSHNIPGKFLTYMQGGLPVLANVNAQNDLVQIIRNEDVGRVSEDNTLDTLERMFFDLLETLESDPGISARCRRLYANRYSSETAVRQIVTALIGDKKPRQ